MSIKLEPDDVNVVELTPPECDSCGQPATHTVSVDIRNAGIGTDIGVYCETCAENAAKCIRDSLSSEGPG